jgi:glucoamylase
MPLCWAHAEYLMLVHSREKGEIFECPSPVRARYAVGKKDSDVEIWTHAFLASFLFGKINGCVSSRPHPCLVRWTVDGWSSFTDSEGSDSGLVYGTWNLPTQQLPPNATVDFTICQKHKWEGHNFRVTISSENE